MQDPVQSIGNRRKLMKFLEAIDKKNLAANADTVMQEVRAVMGSIMELPPNHAWRVYYERTIIKLEEAYKKQEFSFNGSFHLAINTLIGDIHDE